MEWEAAFVSAADVASMSDLDAAMANTTGVLCPTGMTRTRTSIQTYPLSCANGSPSRALTRCTASAPARASIYMV